MLSYIIIIIIFHLDNQQQSLATVKCEDRTTKQKSRAKIKKQWKNVPSHWRVCHRHWRDFFFFFFSKNFSGLSHPRSAKMNNHDEIEFEWHWMRRDYNQIIQDKNRHLDWLFFGMRFAITVEYISLWLQIASSLKKKNVLD